MLVRLAGLAALMALGAILAARAALAQTTSEEAMPAGEMMGPMEVPITLNEWSIDGRNLAVTASTTIRLMVNNAGQFGHALAISGQGNEWVSSNLARGESLAWEITVDKPGVYQVWCPIASEGRPSHRDQGMVGTLTVTPEDQPAATKATTWLGDFWIQPLSTVAVAGVTTSLDLQNVGERPHQLVIKGKGGEWQSERLEPGTSTTWDITLETPGTYEVWCPVGNGNHKRAGMAGTLEVLPSGAPPM